MADRMCSIEGCELQRWARGWCGKHYKRWRSTGDPLTPKMVGPRTRPWDGPEGSVPLRNRAGEVTALTWVDAEDQDEIRRFNWYLSPRGYAIRQYKDQGSNRMELLHRRLMGLVRGDGLQIDHVDHDPLNNRRANLRIVTAFENNQNLRAGRGLSGVPAVHWISSRQKWAVRVVAYGQFHWGGYFDRVEDAAKRAEELRREVSPYRRSIEGEAS